jgi:hypothetical protein
MELEAGRRQLDALCTQFSTELERAREAVTLDAQRFDVAKAHVDVFMLGAKRM